MSYFDVDQRYHRVLIVIMIEQTSGNKMPYTMAAWIYLVAVLGFITPLSCQGLDESSYIDHLGQSGNIPNGFKQDEDALNLRSSLVQTDIAFVHFLRDEIGDDTEVLVWLQTDVCVGCKLLPVAMLTNETTRKRSTARIDTQWATRIAVTTSDLRYPDQSNTYCQLYYEFGLFGEYNLTIPKSSANRSSIPECKLVTLKEPIYPNTAIIVVYCVVFFIAFAYGVWFYCIKKRFYKDDPLRVNGVIQYNNEGKVDDEAPLTGPATTSKSSSRLRSVDTLRGIAILQLVSGVSGDGHYWFYMHSKWYGITIADFMFPWFIFISGTSIHLAFNNLLSKGVSFKEIYKKLVMRFIKLFVLGVCLQKSNDIRVLRIPGVLQRIGFSYFVVGSCYLFSRWLLSRRTRERTGALYKAFRDIVDYFELPLAVCCVTAHLCITLLLPVPGCPRGYQGPGGPLVGENGELTNCTGGAAGYIDKMFFTKDHMISSILASKVYHTSAAYDPEGILGSLTSIALCAFGLQAGKILHLFDTTRGRVTRLVVWGVYLIACAAVLTKCHFADGWIPLNKNLWSVSYIALTGGIFFIAQAILHVMIDVTQFWNGAPWIYAGMNSILLYTGAEVGSTYLPFTWHPIVGTHVEYVIMGSWCMLVWILIATICYKKKIVLKL